MTTSEFYNDLELSLQKVADLWAEGAANRRSPLHTPVVASLDFRDGQIWPSQRVMVLRLVDWDKRQLRFHTDKRSPKCDELQRNAAVSVLGYHPDEKVQMRLSGLASILADGPEADAAWAESTEFAKRCYLAELAPGQPSNVPTSGLPADVEGRKPTEKEVTPARTNFAVVLIAFDTIDWLYLANSGHRRAKFSFDAGTDTWAHQWCAP